LIHGKVFAFRTSKEVHPRRDFWVGREEMAKRLGVLVIALPVYVVEFSGDVEPPFSA
jgi:hypothetical protein